MTVMTSPQFSTRTSAQKVCIGLGSLFLLVGLFGFVAPGFMGMHLSIAHNLVHIVSGALALWMGEQRDSKAAYVFSIAFGAVYGLLGIAGFVFGREAVPMLMHGNVDMDSHLLSIIPGTLEFGTMDHVVHILIGALFIIGALNSRTDKIRPSNPRV